MVSGCYVGFTGVLEWQAHVGVSWEDTIYSEHSIYYFQPLHACLFKLEAHQLELLRPSSS
jgi:hypothetical protein